MVMETAGAVYGQLEQRTCTDIFWCGESEILAMVQGPPSQTERDLIAFF